MLAPTGPRHPLFRRLQKPLAPVYADAVTLTAWDDDRPIKKARGLAYTVTKSCPQLQIWARQLRELHREDDSYKTKVDITRLSATPIMAKNLHGIGQWDVEYFDDEFSELKSPRRAWHADASTTLMTVIVERLGGRPIGFVSFEMRWSIAATADADEEIEFDLEPDQAWIAPEHRYKGWGSTAAIAVAFAAHRHVRHIEQTTRWPAGIKVPLRIFVNADVYSTSGDRWLHSCANYVSSEFDFCGDLGSFELTTVELESRI